MHSSFTVKIEPTEQPACFSFPVKCVDFNSEKVLYGFEYGNRGDVLYVKVPQMVFIGESGRLRCVEDNWFFEKE